MFELKTLLNRDDRKEVIERIENLTIDSKRQWGEMDAHQIVVHLTTPLLVALGERLIPFKPNLFSLPVVKILGSQIVPWWHGAPSTPEFLNIQTRHRNFHQDRNALVIEIGRFVQVAKDKKKEFPPHPVFGELTNEEWARLMWRHIDHHLRQYGC